MKAKDEHESQHEERNQGVGHSQEAQTEGSIPHAFDGNGVITISLRNTIFQYELIVGLVIDLNSCSTETNRTGRSAKAEMIDVVAVNHTYIILVDIIGVRFWKGLCRHSRIRIDIRLVVED